MKKWEERRTEQHNVTTCNLTTSTTPTSQRQVTNWGETQASSS
jgi:hypothetical protein